MVNFKASHWSRALLVFSSTHLGVEGFVIYVWDLSNLGYSPYMTNLGDKSYIIIIRDDFITVPQCKGPIFDKYWQTPTAFTNLGVCRYLSNMGSNPVLIFSMEFVKYGWGLSNMGPLHWGTVMNTSRIILVWCFLDFFQFYQYGRDISPYLTNPNDKPLPKILVRGTHYNF